MTVRINDAPFPVASNDAECDTHGLHVVINLFVEGITDNLWDVANWDDAQWEEDQIWRDIAGDVRGLVVQRSANEANEQPASAFLTLELDNSDGTYSQFDETGNQSNFAIGGIISVWVGDEWKFYGRITRWEEDYGQGPNVDYRRRQSKVTVEAFDAMFLLNQDVDGVEYPIGLEGDATPARLVYLANLVGFDRGLKLSDAPMRHRNILSTNPILETMQVTAESAGGFVFIDVDGKLAFLNQNDTIDGRPDQPQPIPIFSDTCSDDTWDFWDGDPITDDSLIRNNIVLTNVDAVQVTATDQLSVNRRARRPLPREDQTWSDVSDANIVAQILLDQRSNAYFHVADITLYGSAPELRIGDLIRYIRTLSNGTRIDANLLVIGHQWSTSPEGDTTIVSTAPVSAVNAFARWNTALWDEDLWVR